MDLQKHYNDLYSSSIDLITNQGFKIDKNLDVVNDQRLGVSLIIKVNPTILLRIQDFLNKLRSVDPQQYYYEGSQIHITVLSIISCYQGFSLNNIHIEEYISLIQNSLIGIKTFNIEYKGITASDSTIMIQGFPSGKSLEKLRDSLRINFHESSLQQSIDIRYKTVTAHSTVARFRKKLNSASDFITILNRYREHYFGSQEVGAIDLVLNDWYHLSENVEYLHSFQFT